MRANSAWPISLFLLIFVALPRAGFCDANDVNAAMFDSQSMDQWKCIAPASGDSGDQAMADCLRCGKPASDCASMVTNYCTSSNYCGTTPSNGCGSYCTAAPTAAAPPSTRSLMARPPSGPTPGPGGAAPTAAKTKPPKANGQPDGSAPAKPSGDPDTDQQTCQSKQQAATNCCSNPSSCTGGSGYGSPYGMGQPQFNNQQGMNQTCQQQQQLANQQQQMSANAASALNGLINDCVNTCNSLADANSSNSSASSAMKSAVSTCQGLQQCAQRIGSSGMQNYQTGGNAQNCNNNTQAGGGSGGGGSPGGGMGGQGGPNPFDPAQNNNPYGCNSNPGSPACQNCKLNPESPSCKAMADAQERPQGKIGFQAGAKKDGSAAGGFDPKSTTDGVSPRNQIAPVTPDPNAKPSEAPVVANNSGGQIPGGQGSTRPASLDNGKPKRGSAGAPGYTTEIDKGMMSGGYSQGAAGGGTYGSNSQTAPPTTGGSRGPASNIDLKKYLPGASLDPQRHLGGSGMYSAEINGKYTDLFKKISARMQEKCKLGVLFECR